MVVASSIEGRLRIRDEALTKEGVARSVREALLAIPGVSEVTVNQRVGSILVIYGRAVTGVDRILNILADLFAAGLSSAKGLVETVSRETLPRLSLDRKTTKRAVNLGMLSALLLSLVGAVLDATALHVIAGIIFLAFFGVHIFERRQSLFG